MEIRGVNKSRSHSSRTKLLCGGWLAATINKQARPRLAEHTKKSTDNETRGERNLKKRSNSSNCKRQGSMDLLEFFSIFCCPGSFYSLAKRLRSMVQLDLSVIGGIFALSNVPRSMMDELTDVCTAGLGADKILYFFCFPALVSVLFQFSITTGTLIIISKKRGIDELLAACRQWCRGAILAVVIVQTIMFLCSFIILFWLALHCWGELKHLDLIIAIAGDVLAVVFTILFCLNCSSTALYGH
ncbi:hypothetical protein EJB05_23089 [Eragrostis curvula]|uniref:Uncharacterized protein n=1 Tax=Eragrostis curvula TaxID=38414 RepID=A0A5J9V627_9POAL|nr:hypothetical protein EJB05_23089 [Eragrostis curvula]